MTKIQIPATTANLGAGFDCLGVALKLYNYIEFEEIAQGLEINILDDVTSGFLPTDERNLIYKSMKHLFDEAGWRPAGLRLNLTNQIPVTRGLGSSAACIAGGLYAANVMLGQRYSERELLCFAAKLEGHSDNATAAIAGGFAISSFEKGDIFYHSHKVKNDLKFVLLIPDFAVTTKKARTTLPGYYPLRDVSYNIAHTALLVSSILSGEYENLLCAVDDRIHQPYRKTFIDGYQRIYNKCRSYGALGTYISGSGPTLVSLVEADDAEGFVEDLGHYMSQNFSNWTLRLLDVDNDGIQQVQ